MKGLFKLLGAIFTFQLGAVVAMLFAQKTGKTLRKDLKNSDNPLKTLFKEGLSVDKDIMGNVSDWAKNSEDLAVLRSELQNLKTNAKDLSAEAKAELQKNLEMMAKEAKAAAEDLKGKAKKKASTTAKKASTKATTAKKKTIKKATTATKKANKTVKKIAKDI